jgi:hypothetical protein
MFQTTWATQITLSAILYFLVQPMIAKLLLPVFGGGTSVWIVCLAFFQLTLFLGYGYSFWLSQVRSFRKQFFIHFFFLLFTVLWFPFGPFPEAASSGTYSPPAIHLLQLLFTLISGPMIVLTSTSPLLQFWWSHARSELTAYRFYSLSNIASLLGLIAYPVLFERTLNLQQQIALWSYLYLCFVLITCSSLSILFFRSNLRKNLKLETADLPSSNKLTVWIVFPAVGSVLLLSISRMITTDIAPAPLLWIVPLALYLVTFSITFLHKRFHLLPPVRILCLVCFLLLPATSFSDMPTSTWQELLVALSSLFAFCSLLHGELSLSKPKKESLTLFHLLVALGGGLGGLFVSVASPLLFDSNVEFVAGLMITGVIYLFSLKSHPPSKVLALPAGLVILIGTFFFLYLMSSESSHHIHQIYTTRNFYGSLTVKERILNDDKTLRILFHGNVEHGAQIISKSGIGQSFPVSYYSPSSGIGQLFAHFGRNITDQAQPPGKPLKVVAVGMGVGAVSAYMRDGDVLRYIEINPAVVDIADRYFSYIARSPIEEQIVVSDGRIGLEKALKAHGPLGADIIILDAFNSDLIPTHLLTSEAFELYFKHLKPEGAVAVLYDSDYSNLLPVLYGNAAIYKKQLLDIYSDGKLQEGIRGVSWAIISSRPELLNDDKFRSSLGKSPKESPVFWTDDFSNTLSVVSWK